MAQEAAPGGRSILTPRLLYGTAWKEDRTEALVLEALRAGFRGIDTANQRKHYHEAGVGAALARAFAEDVVRRGDLFLQTKFTYARAQDHRLPYDPSAPLGEQVAQSCARSLEHLGVEALDSYVLHGPSSYPALSQDDVEVWRAMEALHDDGLVGMLGVSNVTTQQLAALHEAARVKPRVVQNRTLAMPAADLPTRAFCRERGLAYQGFSLLTAAPQLLTHPAVRAFAQRARLPPAAAALRLWGELGVVALTGTTDAAHMAADLAATCVDVLPEEREAFARVVGS